MTGITDHTRHAAEAIRAANHATIDTGHLPAPEVYKIVGELADLNRGLAQLYGQLERNLFQRLDLGGLRHDTHGDTNDTIVAAAVSLRAAAGNAANAGRALSDALNHLCHIADTGATP